jgi:CheY-like chemotaxis protein
VRRVGTLVVDDEPDIRLILRMAIRRYNRGLFVSGEAGSGSDALTSFRSSQPDVIVLDHMLPDMTGLDVAASILEQAPTQIVVLFSAYLDPDIEQGAEALGVARCVSKLDLQKVPDIIHRLASRDQPLT